ncbi:MAG: TIGR01212 family radical SAM protein [Planctomycetaceae bacterium]|jgi:radical SAM protein (TIGR01212 family)|nr:TIGR01212 family radical SAM protein [Planctomycetaceae bacterium]
MKSAFPDWKSMGHRYFPLGVSMRYEFGCAVWKVSVDVGCSCPNIDGTIGTGGCIFCNAPSFAPSRRFHKPEVSISEQIDIGIRQLQRRYGKAEKFIAYFQPSTNTYLMPERLEQFCRTALEHSEIVGLTIGTRPDTLPDEILDMLELLSQTAWIQLEIGLQSIHQKSLDFLNRRHNYPVFRDAFERCRQRNLRLGIHLILGIPGEDRNDVLATAREIARLQPDCVKLHHLYVVRKTQLEKLWQTGKIRLTTLEEYAGLVVDFLEVLPPNIVIDRISGEADASFLLAPDWTGIKHAARNAVNQEFQHRCSFQGFRHDSALPTL